MPMLCCNISSASHHSLLDMKWQFTTAWQSSFEIWWCQDAWHCVSSLPLFKPKAHSCRSFMWKIPNPKQVFCQKMLIHWKKKKKKAFQIGILVLAMHSTHIGRLLSRKKKSGSDVWSLCSYPRTWILTHKFNDFEEVSNMCMKSRDSQVSRPGSEEDPTIYTVAGAEIMTISVTTGLLMLVNANSQHISWVSGEHRLSKDSGLSHLLVWTCEPRETQTNSLSQASRCSYTPNS